MDPLTTTLAVISLATAVKDLVKLAQDIYDAFAKAPQNYKKAVNLASDLLRTLKQIQAIYGKKKEILEITDDLKLSLQGLSREMTLVRNECVRLIPPVSEKTRDKFKIAFYSFWNRKKVEGLVLELKARIDRCYKDFSLLSNIRTEATVNQISQIVANGTTVQAQSYSREGYRSDFLNISSLSHAGLFQFSQSYSTSMTRIEDIISDRDLDKLILHRELGRIEKSLGHLTSSWHENLQSEPLRVPSLNTSWKLYRPPISDTAAYQSLVVSAFQLHSLIDSADIFTISNAISSFSNKLGGLGMLEDDLTVTLWAVEFWQDILSSSLTDDLNAWVHLAYKLTNASISYSAIGDRDKAYAKSQEAIEIIQGKLGGNLSTEIQELLAQNLCTQAENISTPTLSSGIELATRAVVTMEAALNLRKIQAENSDLDAERGASSLHDSLYTYSKILFALSDIQENRGCMNEAYITRKRAWVVLHSLLLEYPDSQRLLRTTAPIVLDLCDSTFSDFNSLADNLEYAEEGVKIYRRLLQSSFPTYIIFLLDALQSYSQILLSAGMDRKLTKISEEMAALTEITFQRYQDLKAPSESDGDCQFHLATILYKEGFLSEGTHAARNAVEQYSALAFLDPQRSPLKLIRALIILCQIHFQTKQYQSAITEGFKALRLIDNSSARDEEIQDFAHSDEHISLINCIMDALAASPRHPGSVDKASTIFSRFRNLFFSADKPGFVSCAPGIYMAILDKNGLANEAINHGQDFISAWKRKHAYSERDNSIYSYLTCIEKLIDILKDCDRTDDALECLASAIPIVGRCSQHYKDPFIHNLQCDLTSTQIRLLCGMGLYEAALEFAQAACCSGNNSSLCSSHDHDCRCILDQLLDLATMQLHNYLPLQAIETARKAESIVRSKFSKIRTDDSEFFVMSNWSRYLLSDALFDAERTSESLVHLNDIKIKIEMKDEVHPDWKSAFDEDRRLVSATIARICFVQSDYAQAKHLVIQVLKMGRQLLSEKQSHFVTLAIDLLFAGIVFCCVDEHESGITLLTEVYDRQRKFSVTHPALAREVEFSLQMQAQRGQWRLIQTVARAKLTCNHVDQALNLSIACMGSNELEFAKK